MVIPSVERLREAAERVCAEAEAHEEQWKAGDYELYEPLRKALNELEALDGEWVLPRVDEIGQRPDDGLDFTRGLLNALGILIVLAAVIVAILVVVL